MKLVEVKKIPEINKTYVRIIGRRCDECGKEIGHHDLYLFARCANFIYEDSGWNHKHFCMECGKDAMWDIFTKNQYFNFDKEIGFNPTELFQCDEWDFDRYGYEVIREEEVELK